MASSAQATTWTYGFDGNLSAQFSPLSNTGGTVVQSGGALNFSTPELSGNVNQTYSFIPFVPTFNQSWSAQINVMIPLSLDNLSINKWFVTAGIGALTVASDGTVYTFVSTLETGTDQDPSGRIFNPELTVGDSEIDDGIGINPTSLQSATLTMSYDAVNKLFTAGNQDGALRTIDASAFVAAEGGNHPMEIFIGFGTDADVTGLSIPSSTPVTLSNFSVTSVPEPESSSLLLLGLGLLAPIRFGWKFRAECNTLKPHDGGAMSCGAA